MRGVRDRAALNRCSRRSAAAGGLRRSAAAGAHAVNPPCCAGCDRAAWDMTARCEGQRSVTAAAVNSAGTAEEAVMRMTAAEESSMSESSIRRQPKRCASLNESRTERARSHRAVHGAWCMLKVRCWMLPQPGGELEQQPIFPSAPLRSPPLLSAPLPPASA
jgi:hypothetical protein